MLLHLADYMLKSQETDASVDYVMRNTRVHIIASMNPDGSEIAIMNDCHGSTGRYNANGFNLSDRGNSCLFVFLFVC